jgi:hypothetical protein
VSALHSDLLREFRRHPLALGVAAIFLLAAPDVMAATIQVANCSDGFPAPIGSLREAVPLAGEDGTVDLTLLPAHGCSTVTLTAGEIAIPQQNLYMVGPSSGVTITSNFSWLLNSGRILHHTGYGGLVVKNLTIGGGSVYSTSQGMYGGCILSRGKMVLDHSVVESCLANAKNHPVAGGGISVRGNLYMFNSTITGSAAGSISSSKAYGGGADVGGRLSASESTISNNVAGKSGTGVGGGIYTLAPFNLESSTISGNTAGQSFGGISSTYNKPGYASVIHNSTISGNKAIAGVVGGIYSNISVDLQNSTIAFNTAGSGKRSYYHYDAPGLDVVSVSGGVVSTTIQSSILSNNTYQGLPNDFSEYNISGSLISASGANNLIGTTTVTSNLGVIAGRCPLLAPLSDNGGPTQTHALQTHSSAIDQGNDNTIDGSTGMPFLYDQRGMPFQRTNHGQADIGAYEVQQEEVVFSSGFDGCLN